MPTINGQRVLNSAVPKNDRGGVDKVSNKEQVNSGGQVGALNIVQPTVSAKDLANPVPQVNPPAPTTPVPNNRTGAVVDNVLRDTQGFITNQSAEAQKARELANTLGAFGEQSGAGDLRNTLNNQYQIPENLKTLQDIQLQLASNKTSTELQQSQIANAAGQTVGQAQREVTQADREGAIRDAGLAARAAVLQGNIETASSLVSQAVSDFNADRTAKNQNILQQLDYYQSISDEQTGQLIEQEKRKYEADQAAIERVQGAVDEAMASGAATERDIAQLTNPKLTDEERLAVAQGISARAATEMRNLDVQAKQANIAQSYASIASSNTNRLLALAEAGDENAIKQLKFDPRTIKEEIDPVTRRQLESSLDSGTNLLRLASNYQKLIDDYGYTNRTFGNTEVLGQISSLRALMTAEYKKAETLGTLDAGVLALMSQIVGEEPTSGLFTPLTNATGRRSDKLSAQLGTFIENITLAQARDKARLGIEPTVDFSVITEDDDLEISNLMGVQTTTNQQGGFNPNSFFK